MCIRDSVGPGQALEVDLARIRNREVLGFREVPDVSHGLVGNDSDDGGAPSAANDLGGELERRLPVTARLNNGNDVFLRFHVRLLHFGLFHIRSFRVIHAWFSCTSGTQGIATTRSHRYSSSIGSPVRSR